MAAMELPSSSHVDVSVLVRLLDETTNSYKYLFLLSLLDELQLNYAQDPSALCIPKKSLAVGMLIHGWYPHQYFKLSFGTQDQLAKLLDAIRTQLGPEKFAFDQSGQRRLRTRLEQTVTRPQLRDLTRYVQQRLLRPFFQAELRGHKDATVDQRLVELAREKFDDVRPLYRLEPDGLVMHPDWVHYLRTHHRLVWGWTCWHWALYMQGKNPNVPAVPMKLFAPQQRSSLSQQWTFWKRAMKQGDWRCIYTGQQLELARAQLDHFVPWSFVAHDQLWNLVPVSDSANSSKGDWLPDITYLDKFYDIQARALVSARHHYTLPGWTKATESYVADLHVPESVLWTDGLDQQALTVALYSRYQATLPSLISLGKSVGFQAGWSA